MSDSVAVAATGPAYAAGDGQITVVGALLGLHAQTSLHAGSGAALGTVDLPIQRERHTGWPNIAASAIKGVLRDICREQIAGWDEDKLNDLPRYDDGSGDESQTRPEGSKRQRADATMRLNRLFGPPTEGAGEFAGALSLTDARLLAFPVRSAAGVFGWITCPAVLQRLQRDARLAGMPLDDLVGAVPDVLRNQAAVPTGCGCLIGRGQLLLEEFNFQSIELPTDPVGDVARWISDRLFPNQGDVEASFAPTKRRFQRQLVVLCDDDYTHFVRTATEVTARIGLDYESKTVRSGALFYQEFLPAESLLYSVVLANAFRGQHGNNRRQEASASCIQQDLIDQLDSIRLLQIGGDETTGKGICAVRLGYQGEETQP